MTGCCLFSPPNSSLVHLEFKVFTTFFVIAVYVFMILYICMLLMNVFCLGSIGCVESLVEVVLSHWWIKIFSEIISFFSDIYP